MELSACQSWDNASAARHKKEKFETIRLAYSYDRDYALEILNRYLPKSFTPNRNRSYALVYSLIGIDGAERLSKLGQRLRGAA